MLRLKRSRKLEAKLHKVLEGVENKSAVHLSVIDLSGRVPVYAGVKDRRTTYPASVYKIFVAMAGLNLISQGKLSLGTKVRVSEVNTVDKAKEVPSDPRPLLRAGREVFLSDLLDLMITRSDNTAANVLIDLITRYHINELLFEYGWHTSRVTRKFLRREVESDEYRTAKATVSTTRQLAEFLYLVETGKLVNSWVSSYMHELLSKQRDRTKMRRGLPKHAKFAHKTGWFFASNRDDGACCDCGIVSSGRRHYVVACMIWDKEKRSYRMIRQISESLYKVL